MNAAQGTAAQADEALGVLDHRLQRYERIRGGRSRPSIARMGVRAREDAAQIGPPPGVLHQQGDVATVVELEL